LTAHVAASGTPTGTVYFLSNGVIIGSSPLDGSGNATVTTTALPAGSDLVRAVYGGDVNGALSSSAPSSMSVSPPLAATVTSLAMANTGAIATFSASVIANSDTAVPAGTVTFLSDGVALGSASLANAAAFLSIMNLAAGSHTVQAVYSGDANCQGSSASVSIVAGQGPV
jgi:hypothetical protein